MSGYYGASGSGTTPALTANTLTVANQAARLALVFGDDPDAGEVGLRDQVWQESDNTLWVLLASDPSLAGSWGPLNSFPASVITSGTLDAARIHASMTADKLGYLSSITSSVQTQLDAKVALENPGGDEISRWGTYGFVQMGPNVGAAIGWWGGQANIAASVSKMNFGLGATGNSAQLTGKLGVGTGALFEAAKRLEVVDSAAAQLRLTHTAATDYADFTVDTDGILTLTPSGGKVIVTGTLVTATATPASASATGTTGQWAWDGSYLYIATATNTWKRVAVATW